MWVKELCPYTQYFMYAGWMVWLLNFMNIMQPQCIHIEHRKLPVYMVYKSGYVILWIMSIYVQQADKNIDIL